MTMKLDVKEPANDEDDLDRIDVGALIGEAMQEDDENDPLLESYQKYKTVSDPANLGVSLP